MRDDKRHSHWYIQESLLSQERLHRIVTNANFDSRGTFVAHDNGQLIGFGRCIVKKVQTYKDEVLVNLSGYCEGLVLKTSFRRRGIGSQIFQAIESHIMAEGKKDIQIGFYHSGIDGLSILPDIPEYTFLLKHNCRPESREMKLRLDITGFILGDDMIRRRNQLKSDGIDIRYYEREDETAFYTFMDSEFKRWWRLNYRPNIERDTPLPVLIAVHEHKVIGFIGFVAVGDNRRANFNPGTGVDVRYRNRGIDKVLVSVWINEVKAMGQRNALF